MLSQLRADFSEAQLQSETGVERDAASVENLCIGIGRCLGGHCEQDCRMAGV